jgi:hypothetical protein
VATTLALNVLIAAYLAHLLRSAHRRAQAVH